MRERAETAEAALSIAQRQTESAVNQLRDVQFQLNRVQVS